MAYAYNVLTAAEIALLDNYEPWTFQVKLSKFIDKGVSALQSPGSYGNAHLVFPAQPVDTDTIGIGSDVYEFDDNGAVTPGRIAVTIGLTVAATSANLVHAINFHGTEHVFAEVATIGGVNSIYVRAADGVGGLPMLGYYSIALTENITNVSDIWSQSDLAGSGMFWQQNRGMDWITIDGVNILTPFVVEFPFAVRQATFSAYRANALIATTATVTANGTSKVLVNAAAGATPLQVGDLLVVEAIF